MLPAGFEPAIPVSGQRQTYALDRAATRSGDNEPQASKFLSNLGPVSFSDSTLLHSVC